jgi:electron transfer flavoprotein alpha subunit
MYSPTSPAHAADEARWQHFIQCDKIISFVSPGKTHQLTVCRTCCGCQQLNKQPKKLALSRDGRHRVFNLISLSVSEVHELQNRVSEAESYNRRIKRKCLQEIARSLSASILKAVLRDPEVIGRQLFEEVTTRSATTPIHQVWSLHSINQNNLHNHRLVLHFTHLRDILRTSAEAAFVGLSRTRVPGHLKAS